MLLFVLRLVWAKVTGGAGGRRSVLLVSRSRVWVVESEQSTQNGMSDERETSILDVETKHRG